MRLVFEVGPVTFVISWKSCLCCLASRTSLLFLCPLGCSEDKGSKYAWDCEDKCMPTLCSSQPLCPKAGLIANIWICLQEFQMHSRWPYEHKTVCNWRCAPLGPCLASVWLHECDSQPKRVIPNDKVGNILGVVGKWPGSREAYAVLSSMHALNSLALKICASEARCNLYSASTMANNITLKWPL